MYQITELFERASSFSHWTFEFYCEPYIDFNKFSVDQICVILEGFEIGLPNAEIDFYAKPCFSELQMMEIQEVFEHKLSIHEVSTFADSNFTLERMAMERDKIIAQKNK